MTKHTKTARIPEPREVYASPCRRVVVIRHAPCDFETRCDGVTLYYAKRQHEAEHAGALWLAEQMETMERAA